MLAMIVILSVSYVYTSVRRIQLSNEVEKAKRKVCSEQGDYDCELISKYHDECFSLSYRAEFRTRSFHPGEYNDCIDGKLGQTLLHLNREGSADMQH
jgi:hypothetical protein